MRIHFYNNTLAQHWLSMRFPAGAKKIATSVKNGVAVLPLITPHGIKLVGTVVKKNQQKRVIEP